MEEGKEDLWDPEGSKTPQENLQNQLTRAYGGSLKTELPTREHAQALCIDVVADQLCLHLGLLKQDQGLSLSQPAFESLSPNGAALSSLSGRG